MHAAEAVTGGCLCGAVRYEARAHLKDAYYCHCRICQKTSGAPAEIGVLVVPGSLRFLVTEPKHYRSSPFGQRGFCAICGSRLTWADAVGQRPEWTNLSVGSLDDPAGVVPVSHQCSESAMAWYRIEDGLPRLTLADLPEVVAAWGVALP